MIKLKVNLKERSYPIFIGTNILGKTGEIYDLYGFGRKAVIITNSTLDKLYSKPLEESFDTKRDKVLKIVIGDGERFKTLRTASSIYTRLLQEKCDRTSTILAFGGGVVGDIAGFVAATFMRGIPYLQIPTSLLAQVDSSVGGKVAVNHPLGKNMIGAFYQPKLVWIDVALLKTLPRRELICGLGEVIKYGVIWDEPFFGFLEENLDKITKVDPDILQKVVKRCCQIKAEVVSRDERETNLRMILNFGHTIAHALETATQYRRFKHGEAVLLGMLGAGRMALEMGIFDQGDFERLESLIKRIKIRRKVADLDIKTLKGIMASDKKARDGKIRFVLPKRIGEVFVTDEVDDRVMTLGLKYLKKELR